jgi:hypothetical protein
MRNYDVAEADLRVQLTQHGVATPRTMTAAIGGWFAEQIPGVKVERRARKATP